MRYLTVEQVKAGHGTAVKFVKVAGLFRFFSYYFNHTEAVGKEEQATAAGLLTIEPGCVRMAESYSSTLRIGCSADDEDELVRVLGVAIKGRFE
jgi:hypothetical protein